MPGAAGPGGRVEPTTIDRTLIQGNTAPRAAIYLMGTALTMTASTVAGNTGTGGWGGLFVSKHWLNGNDVAGSATLTDVTIAGNGAGSSLGGALWVGDTLTSVTLTHVTIANNAAEFGAVAGDGAGGVVYRDVLVAGNTANNVWERKSCLATGSGNVMQWPATNGSGAETSCGSSTTFLDPLLASALADNGGDTPTLALGAGSPAIGAGQSCTGTSQNGVARKTPCALGAYEPP